MSELDDLKIIDFHVHVGLKEHWHESLHDYQKSAQSEFYDRYEELTNPAKFAAYLRCCNIEKAVILPEISPLTSGVVSNEYVFEFCQEQDVLLPFCTINPSLTDDPERDIKSFIQMGAKGIKLYPSYNHFYPNQKQLYPVYELAQEHELPVLIHTGSSVFKGSKMKFADPIHLDEIASDFPGLILLMAHSGRGIWYDKAFFLSRLHPHLYMEISGLPPKNLLKYFPDLEKNIDKVVYGSDWPGIKNISVNINAIKKLPLPSSSIKKMLYGNAARILGIKDYVNTR
jgi:predicted TIM-barrel fold metal-dependent hydrolase